MKRNILKSLCAILTLAVGGVLCAADAAPAGVLKNGSFEETVPYKGTTWKVAENLAPKSWTLKEGNSAKELAILKLEDGTGSFLRLTDGKLEQALPAKGSKVTITYRYRGNGCFYFYIVPYAQNGSNLPSVLVLNKWKTKTPEWTVEKVELEIPAKSLDEAGRRNFWLWVHNKTQVDFDYINIDIK